MMQDSRRAVSRLLVGLPSQYRRHRSAAAVQKKVTSVPREVSSAKASKSTSSASAPSLRTSQLRVRRTLHSSQDLPRAAELWVEAMPCVVYMRPADGTAFNIILLMIAGHGDLVTLPPRGPSNLALSDAIVLNDSKSFLQKRDTLTSHD